MKDLTPAQSSIRQALRAEWEMVSPPLRKLASGMTLTGGIAAVAGVAADVAGLWSKLPFLTNLATSATAALFGIPIALLVLQRVARHQEESRERASLKAQARHFAGQLSTGVMFVCGGALGGSGSDLLQQNRRLREAIAAMRSALQGGQYPSDPGWSQASADLDRYKYWQHVRVAADALDRMSKYYRQHGVAARKAEQEWRSVNASAAFLFDQIRPRYLEVFGVWIKQEWADSLNREFISPAAPLPRRFFEVLGREYVRELIKSGLQEDESPGGLVVTPAGLNELAEAGADLVTHFDMALKLVEMASNIDDALELTLPNMWLD